MNPTVWIVDDSPMDARQAQRVLSPHAQVENFSDGSSALERLATGSMPDVMVLDWVMPGITGLEVVKFLRSQHGPLSRLPVLLLTARNQPEQTVEGLGAGANDYVAKPYSGEELWARVDSLARSASLLARATAAEVRLRELITSTPDPLVSVDRHGVVTFANAEAQRMFGDGRAVVGETLTALLPGLSGRLEQGGTLADMRLGDRVYSPSVAVTPGAGSTDAIVALRDVTDRRRAEQRRLDFYSIIAHDLRSPLSAMKLRLYGLLKGRRGVMPAEAAGELRRMDAGIGTMATIIDDFLDIAQLQGGASNLERAPLRLVQLVDATVEDLRPLAEERQLNLELNAPVPHLSVLGDASRLKQVVSNLVGNAIKFTPPGGTIEVSVEKRGEHVETRVTDTGPGIEKDALPRLFDRFTRAGDTKTTGWGLGLMIVREIVESHGGEVGVESEPGRGSTFWFKLKQLR
jgi:signal transduction histidine kinase